MVQEGVARQDLPAVGYPFIKVTLVDGTPQGTSLTWSAKDNRPDYFNSLVNQRYVDQANVTTITLDYVPTGTDSPNKIEHAIVSSKGFCRFQYGITGHRILAFQGRIYNYKSRINEGSVTYTLDIVSESVLTNFTNVPNDLKRIVPMSADTYLNSIFGGLTLSYEAIQLYNLIYYRYYQLGITSWSSWNATNQWYHPDEYYHEKALRRKLVDSYGDGASYIIRVVEDLVANSSDEEIVFKHFERILYRCQSSETVDSTGTQKIKYYFDRDKSDRGFKIPPLGIKISSDENHSIVSPLYALQYFARALVDKEDSSLHSYHIVIDDSEVSGSSYQGRIYLKRVSGTASKAEFNREYLFNWNNRDGDVISWSPSYEGAYYLFSDETTGKWLSSSQVVTGYSGTSVNVMKLKVPASSNLELNKYNSISQESLTQVRKDFNEFAEHANYPYTAELTVIGIPDEDLRLCETTVSIKPYLNGQLHHSQGTYIIYGITDTVSSEGFTTKLSLYRQVDDIEQKKVDVEGTADSPVATYYNDGEIVSGTQSEVEQAVADSLVSADGNISTTALSPLYSEKVLTVV